MRRADRGEIRVGISGWQYDAWRGSFYPEGLPRRSELTYALQRFPTVEVNSTFYSLKGKSVFQEWVSAARRDSVFALKGSRYITHMKRLKDPRGPLANFFGQGLMVLGEHLGPILWQLPQDFVFDEGRLRGFLSALPRSHGDAARLARGHDDRVDDAATEPRASGPIRHALEARHESFAGPASLDLLREHDVALVVSDNPGEFPVLEEPTTDFMYLRLHGPEFMYRGSYPEGTLDDWAERLDAWARQPGDVYVYFDNDADGAAPFDACRLMERLDLAADFLPPGTDHATN